MKKTKHDKDNLSGILRQAGVPLPIRIASNYDGPCSELFETIPAKELEDNLIESIKDSHVWSDEVLVKRLLKELSGGD